LERGLHAPRMGPACEGHAPFFPAWLLMLSGWPMLDSKRGVPGAACVRVLSSLCRL